MINNKKNNVLIAEDEFLISQEIKRLITHLGHTVVGIANNGERAIEKVNELRPDVVIMDITMPKITGIEAAKRIQETRPCPIVILTAHESKDFVEEASAAGVGAYLTKPPKPEELDRAMSIAIARHTDLMKMRELITELEAKQYQLNEANATKDKFMSIIAHDLKSPIGALMGFSEQLDTDFENISAVELKNYLSTFHKTSKGIYELLENLLYWSRLQMGKIESIPEKLNLHESVNEMLELYETMLSSKNLELKTKVANDIELFVDKNMLYTVLRNLITNAIKFTPEGGSIYIGAQQNDKNDITIKIKDTGIGMNDKDQANLFQLDKSFSYTGTEGEKGTGLGLILCHDLLNKMNGVISVDSIINKGTTFTLNFPAQV
jgi:signal transduction histidine kinase